MTHSDGYERARAANEPRVRAEVDHEFADAIRNATSFLQCSRLRRQMERIVQSRLDELVPPDALY